MSLSNYVLVWDLEYRGRRGDYRVGRRRSKACLVKLRAGVKAKARLISKFIFLSVAGFCVGIISGILYVQWLL